MIVEVTGEYDYWEWDTVCRTLDMIGPTEVHTEAGPGAGAEAHYWCQRRGVPCFYEQPALADIHVTFTKERIEVRPWTN